MAAALPLPKTSDDRDSLRDEICRIIHERQSDATVPKATPIRKQGESRHSAHKLNGIQSALDISLRVFARSTKGGLHLIDLNAGDGWNNAAAAPGTALRLVTTAARLVQDVEVRIAMIDSDKLALTDLERRLPLLPANITVDVFHSKNANWLKDGYFSWCRAHRPWGIVVVDPNGVKAGFPAREIERLALAGLWERMDVIAAVDTKLSRLAKKVHYRSDILDFDDIVRCFDKKAWTVQLPAPGDNTSRRTVLVGRNTYKVRGNHNAVGMFRLDSNEGQLIRSYCMGLSPYPDVRTGDLFLWRNS